jgi:hypothetical protein
VETSLAAFERTLTASDSKQNIPFTFRVPAGITQLAIRLTFDPSIVDGLHNLLTLTVFDPTGWRGAGHRHGMHQVAISKTFSSPGFCAGAIQPGEWTVFVDTHLVMPGPACQIRLEVNGVRPDDPALARNGDLAMDKKPQDMRSRASRKIASRGPGWYRGDLHSHSINSDAAWGISDLVTWSRARKLDFATLTDHNTVSGLEQMDAACTGDLLTIGGMELTTFWGHSLALGIRDWVDWRSGEGRRTIEQIAAEVEARGGLFVIAHPLQIGDPYCTGCRWAYPSMMPGSAHVVEVWNGDWGGEAHNEAALKLTFDWLNAGHRLALTSGTDNHGRDPDRMNYAFDTVYASELSEREILRAVRSGHLYLSTRPRLELTASAGADRAIMGDSLQVDPGMKVNLVSVWEGAPQGVALELVTDGQRKSSQHVSPNGAQAWELEQGEAGWCLVTLRETSGRMMALTNPIYLDGRSL